MADQMTPDEMRERADRLRRIARELAAGETVPIWDEDVVPGADALDRLADVRKTYEAWCAWTAGNDVDEDVELLLSDISMAIHGENVPDFSERG